ncbi:MFS transporter [Novosphingobium profundi]|uniref:MFS transporter n=1 Tax=Novosphingobium profundi TaxID=1774954 RepID=UPI001BDADEA9|nr:MFS transporter [Novosphingobium profundi]MBT0670284.1 MFS transporter [Novosphingobium profundi]
MSDALAARSAISGAGQSAAGRPGLDFRRMALLAGGTLGTFAGSTSTVTIPLGVMLVPIATSFGWSRTTVATAFLAQTLSQALCFPLAGWLADRFGTRACLLFGFAALGVTLFAIAASPASPWAFYGLFALSGVGGVLASTMVIAKLVAEWFTERRGFWLGLVGGVGNGLGGMVMPAVSGLLVVALGWRHSFALIGLFVLVCALPVAWASLRSPPGMEAGTRARWSEVPLAGHSFAEAMRSPLFWAIFSAVPLGGGALTGVFANTVTILGTQGLSAAGATLVVTLFALTCVIVEPLVGHILDLAARPRRAAFFYVLAIVGLLILAHAHTLPVAIAGGVLTGMGLGVEFSVLPYLLSRYFGLRDLGAICGVAYTGALIANGVSPVALNAAYDHFGSYVLGIYAIAVMMVYALVVFVLLPRFDRAH